MKLRDLPIGRYFTDDDRCIIWQKLGYDPQGVLCQMILKVSDDPEGGWEPATPYKVTHPHTTDIRPCEIGIHYLGEVQ